MINKQKFSSLSAVIAGAMYIACALFVAIFPNLSADLVGWLTHSDSIERSVILGGTVAGLIEVMIYIYIAARLFAWAFNKSVSK